jgi:methyl coenzyme M reductase subunit C
MARNEQTSNRIGKIASKILRGENVPKKDVKSVAASVLTQRPDKKTYK